MWFRQSKCCEKKGKKIEFSTDTCEETRGRGREKGKCWMRGHGFFRKLYRAGSRGKGFHRARSRRLAYFAANWRAGNKLVLSSRREYLRGPYTSPMRARWIPNEAAISGGELSALKCDRYVCKMKRRKWERIFSNYRFTNYILWIFAIIRLSYYFRKRGKERDNSLELLIILFNYLIMRRRLF